MHAPNHWPDHLPGFKEIVTAYQDAMLDLSVHIRQMFAIGLDLPEDFFEPFYRRPLIQQSLLYYPAPAQRGPQGPQDRRGRAFRHRRLHHPDAGPGRRA
jgi:isopenicillin N synthase-like dioxygenase